MSFEDIALLIDVISTLFIWLVIASSLLSLVLSPYHPVREALDRIVGPFLNPIRRIMPPTGMFDFSPLILIILVHLFSLILINFFRSL